jgi:Zn-dependent protease/CBS domain-containing protein
MRWSFRIGRFAGVELRVHVLFFALLAWQAVAGYARTGSAAATATGLAFIGSLFFVVVLHELGHAVVARVYGIRTRDITLLPIGGVARLERMPEKPSQELLVALAGPAVNVVLAAILAAVHLATRTPLVVDPETGAPFLTSLLYANVMLAAFNLLPAFPMDGGRVLRAALALFIDRLTATRIAARVGQLIAFGLGIYGIWASPLLALIAVFVWIGASAELDATEVKATLRGITVDRAMLRVFDPLAPSEPLARAAELMIAHGHGDFPVVDRMGRVVGVLTAQRIVEGISANGADAPVGTAVDSKFAIAEPSDALESVLQKLEREGAEILVVMDGGAVVGLVTSDRVRQVAALVQAARIHSTPPPGSGRIAARPVTLTS